MEAKLLTTSQTIIVVTYSYFEISLHDFRVKSKMVK